jgi:pilus assembly protein TadC
VIDINVFDAFATLYVRRFPSIKKYIYVSRMPYKAEEYVKYAAVIALGGSIGISFIVMLFLLKFNENILWLFPAFLLSLLGIFYFVLQMPYGTIRTREREVNKEVIFAGRYLLTKLQSGAPLFNSLIDASQSYGICSKYFKEIVDDINTGTPIEDAIENAMTYNASSKFKRVLWQLYGSLKTGSDISNALKATLNAITTEQIIEIKEYGRKLNSYMVFYLVIACVLPSLGLTMFVILSSFLNLSIERSIFFVILFFLVVIQLLFIFVIKASRPMVNL